MQVGSGEGSGDEHAGHFDGNVEKLRNRVAGSFDTERRTVGASRLSMSA